MPARPRPTSTTCSADLHPDRRQAFVLTQVLGLSYEEAAEVCACPVGTIRSRVARARRSRRLARRGRRRPARPTLKSRTDCRLRCAEPPRRRPGRPAPSGQPHCTGFDPPEQCGRQPGHDTGASESAPKRRRRDGTAVRRRHCWCAARWSVWWQRWPRPRVGGAGAADPARPTNVGSHVTAITPPTDAVTVDLLGANAFLQLHVRPGTAVTVMGYENEPYLRIDADGTVEENRQLEGDLPEPDADRHGRHPAHGRADGHAGLAAHRRAAAPTPGTTTASTGWRRACRPSARTGRCRCW